MIRLDSEEKRRWTWPHLVCGTMLVMVLGCAPPQHSDLRTAEVFIDAFYSWDSISLEALLSPGEHADQMLYYQGWAKGANYKILERKPCTFVEAEISCAITVTDDFGSQLDYTATDTFYFQIKDGRIHAARFESNDPPLFEEIIQWMMATKPEVLAGPCQGLFADGETPDDCARAVTTGIKEYLATKSET